MKGFRRISYLVRRWRVTRLPLIVRIEVRHNSDRTGTEIHGEVFGSQWVNVQRAAQALDMAQAALDQCRAELAEKANVDESKRRRQG